MRAREDGGGRAGIVMNGSPLFNGAAESGPSNIRKWLLENDLVDAIVALPTNMYFNTGIATYIWILDNTKHSDRKGLIQLIDGTSFWTRASSIAVIEAGSASTACSAAISVTRRARSTSCWVTHSTTCSVPSPSR
jgi:type I restriction-modification system DNA methylase subunit